MCLCNWNWNFILFYILYVLKFYICKKKHENYDTHIHIFIDCGSNFAAHLKFQWTICFSVCLSVCVLCTTFKVLFIIFKVYVYLFCDSLAIKISLSYKDDNIISIIYLLFMSTKFHCTVEFNTLFLLFLSTLSTLYSCFIFNLQNQSIYYP